MNIVKTAKLKILDISNKKSQNISTKTLDSTFAIVSSALTFYINVCEAEFTNLAQFSSTKEKLNYIENITHITKDNPDILYNFDSLFPKFPSYMRRAVVAEALGIISSHFSRVENWEEKRSDRLSQNKSFYDKKPTLNNTPNYFPTFYKGNMWNNIGNGEAELKVYQGDDWVWIKVNYSTKNLKSSGENRFPGYIEQNPSLVKKGKKYFLHLPFKTTSKLSSKGIEDQIVISVDMGLTNSAVISCINAKGTVIGRLFINQPIEKDQLNTRLNKLSKAHKKSGVGEKPNHWRRINSLQDQIVNDTVHQIIKFAEKHHADVIVLEHLGNFKKASSKKLRFRLQYWAKMRIQDKIAKKAHSLGIRYSKINPNGTSKLAFDGSGEVIRSTRGDLAIFKTGKIYHADLSASYNIGARYFLREILKTVSEMVRLEYEAKVPHILNRNSQTLSTLIRLQEVA